MDIAVDDLVGRGLNSERMDHLTGKGIGPGLVLDHRQGNKIFAVLDQISHCLKRDPTEGHPLSRIREHGPDRKCGPHLAFEVFGGLIIQADFAMIKAGMRHEARADNGGGGSVHDSGGVRIIA
jgi:hypothetical protein